MSLAEFSVAFREIFEISLILAVLYAYLKEIGRKELLPGIFAGAFAAGFASLAAAGAFFEIIKSWEESQALFEGITLILSSVIVSSLVLSVIGKRNINHSIQQGIKRHIDAHSKSESIHLFALFSVALFAFLVVLREGVEMVLFFAGIRMATGELALLPALAGALAAFALSWALLNSIIRFDAAHFLRISAFLLILIAGGLVGQGVHELEEAKVIPQFFGVAYNINPAVLDEGNYPLLHEKGLVGGIVKTLLGIPFSPSWAQLLVQCAYLGAMFFAYSK